MSKKNSFEDLFAPEKEAVDLPANPPRKVLLVDDDPDIHAILLLTLKHEKVEGRPLMLLDAYSGQEALNVLDQHPDIALILLDVVMESEEAGLNLIHHIRDELNNHMIQIILLTGQPGYAPPRNIVETYEINDYQLKEELNTEKIYVSVYTALREYRVLKELEQKQVELTQSKQRYLDLYDNAPDMYLSINPETGTVIECNRTVLDTLGYSLNEIVGISIFDLYHPDSISEVQKAFRTFTETGEVHNAELQVRGKNGQKMDVNLNATAVYDENGKLLYSRSNWIDITERKRSEQQLQLSASVFSAANEGILISDHNANIVDVNAAFTHITGYTRDEVLGKNPRFLKSGHQDEGFYQNMWRDLQEGGSWKGEIWNRNKSGKVYAELLTISAVKNAEGITQHYVALFSDITVQKSHQKQLEHTAYHDALTNLPNRVLLADRLHQAMTQAQRRGLKLALAYLDLDGFKEINDTHGHEAGDHLLIELSNRLKAAVRHGDTVARLGGDEFAIVMIDLKHNSESLPLISRLLEAASGPVKMADKQLNVSASIGVSFFPSDSEVETDPDQLLRQADQAMYQAKLSGKNRYHIFDIQQDLHIRGHHEKVQRIRQALEEGEFILYYQPKVNMRTGSVVGAEALIRWHHPEQGVLSPAVFLPVIEDHPLAVEVGKWVIESALRQMASWRADGINLPVSINVGARQLLEGGFQESLARLLEACPDVPASNLEIEILETSALEDMSNVSSIMHECRNLGVQFSLDDFGTGYSSLTYLKRLPANQIKIDQSFVRDMLNDPDDLAIVKGIIGLATAFQRQVIAEGVETLDHGEQLLQLGCELAQGYAIAKAMPPEAFINWLHTRKADREWTE